MTVFILGLDRYKRESKKREYVLKHEIDAKNKSALLFSSGSSVKVKEISEPLANVGITFFRYLKVFDDCSYITLMNGYNDFLSKYYEVIKDLGNIWGTSIKYAQDSNNPFYLIWPQDGYNRDINMGLFYNYNIWNGLSLIYRKDGYMEIISFAFDRQMDEGVNILLNSRGFIENFSNNFRQNVSVLVGKEEQSKRAIYPNSFDLSIKSNVFAQKKRILEDSITIEANILNTKTGVIKLTEKEMGCLKLLAEGGTSKDVARKANISHRTVEYHLSRMKLKTGSARKSDLVDLFFKNLYSH